jgi:acetoin utilization deacetylase AcuC-like enzyme
MKIVFHNKFFDSTYTNDCASVNGRMESIMDVLKNEQNYEIISPDNADLFDILEVHDKDYVDTVYCHHKLYQMALLAAGGAILAADIGFETEPAFACVRPPGHHAYRKEAWGYCHFCNMAIALTKLRKQKKINSAFILDFDAHTGDGTKDCLKDWSEVKILNPMSEPDKYIDEIEYFIKDIDYVDIIAVSAGFDSYHLDVGGKLQTFDFYNIGRIMKNLSIRMGHGRRFAVLEGGYYLPDLGKNVLAFCQGFE